MAFATMAEIRLGLNTRLATISGLAQTSAYMMSSPSPPMMQVMGVDEVTYDEAMQRGVDRLTFVVQAFAGTPDDQAAQVLLDGWLAASGSGSVKGAIEGDITLGGKVTSARVTRAAGYREYDLPNRGKTLGTEFYIEVFNQK